MADRKAAVPTLYRPADAAACIGVSRAMVYELIRSRRLRARKLDGATLVLRADLESFVNALPDIEPDRAEVP